MRWEGRAWLLERHGALIDDIDTDMIYHNSHLAITEISQMGQYALGNLKGYEQFASEAKAGDIVIAGRNFGSGSSRQQAVDCFRSLGIGCILSHSYGAIYKRNAINSGFPILVLESLEPSKVKRGDMILVDADACAILKGKERAGSILPMPRVQRDILSAGDIFEYAKRIS
ncbi:MAG: 3-isopropylmalate dehydratase [Candidatus Thermoplasmatota archaeon]